MRNTFIPAALAVTAALVIGGCNDSADNTQQHKAAERTSVITTPAPVVTTTPAVTAPLVTTVPAPRLDEKARTSTSADVVSPGAKPIPPENGPKLVTAETYPVRDGKAVVVTTRDAGTDTGMGKGMSSDANKDMNAKVVTDRDATVVDPALRTDAKTTEVVTEPVKVDNSGQNKVDKDNRTMTPMDQGSSETDIAITRAIRKALTGDTNMSTNAQNLKIITSDSVVVLRGPVASQAEAEAVLAHVRNVPGITRVENQIAVP